MNRTIFLGLLCIALNGCSLDSEPQHLSNETVATKTVSNNGLSVSLHFKGKVNTDNDQLEWNETSQEPYIAAANKWLSVLKGIEGKEHHHVDINVYVEPLDNANGMAGPDEDEKVGPYYFPLSGEIIIGSHTYQIGFDQKSLTQTSYMKWVTFSALALIPMTTHITMRIKKAMYSVSITANL